MADHETTSEPRRRRNAEATREAILAAARTCFTRASYEQVGVRDIAALVGVNAALVIRYFGSKEQLFALAVTQAFDVKGLLDGPRSELGERLARVLLDKEPVPGAFDPLVALLRSAPNEHAAALLRAGVDEQFIHPLAEYLGGEQATLRAGLIGSYLIGIAVTREVIRSEALAIGGIEPLIALVAPVLQGYVDGATTV